MKGFVKRGEVYYADFDPTVGSEQGGVRPLLIIQNDVGNKYSPTTVVVPFYRGCADVGSLGIPSVNPVVVIRKILYELLYMVGLEFPHSHFSVEWNEHIVDDFFIILHRGRREGRSFYIQVFFTEFNKCNLFRITFDILRRKLFFKFFCKLIQFFFESRKRELWSGGCKYFGFDDLSPCRISPAGYSYQISSVRSFQNCCHNLFLLLAVWTGKKATDLYSCCTKNRLQKAVRMVGTGL